MLIYDYDELVDEFATDLNEKLRSHGAKHESLALWVSSEDPIEGISNLIEAALEHGEDVFTISVKYVTLKTDMLLEIRQRVATLCTISVITDEQTHFLKIIRKSNASNSATGFIEDKLTQERSILVDYEYGRSYASEMPAALKVILENIAEPKLHRDKETKKNYLVSKYKNLSLMIELDVDNIVRHIECEGSGQTLFQSKLLNLFCDVCLNLPIREVVDHGLIKVIARIVESLNDEDKAGLPAIMLPFNLGPEFSNLHHLIRAWRKAFPTYLEDVAYNEYNASISPAWAKLTRERKFEKLRSEINIYCKIHEREEKSILVEKLEDDLLGRPVRLFISICSSISDACHPELITSLEKYLKSALETNLQVYYVEAKDTNRIRRLGS